MGEGGMDPRTVCDLVRTQSSATKLLSSTKIASEFSGITFFQIASLFHARFRDEFDYDK
jgi:hypothetical protein